MFAHSQKTEVEKQNALFTVQSLFSAQVLIKLRSRLIKKFDLKKQSNEVNLNKDSTKSTKLINESPNSISKLPNEMLENILGYLDKNSLIQARQTCSRWGNVVEKRLKPCLPEVNVSRLTITYLSESQTYKLSWCQYQGTGGEPKLRELLITKHEVKTRTSFDFPFSQLNFQRLIIEKMGNGSFNDQFVRFLCQQFGYCRTFAPLQLTIKSVDMGKLSSDVLKNLLMTCSAKLEILEFYEIDNVAPDLITDEHVMVLNNNKVRRLSIQFKESDENEEIEELQISDSSLEAFTEKGIFPAFTIGRCMVTAPAVCKYVNEWLSKSAQSECLKSHALTLSDCPNMSTEEFEEECRKLNLNVRKSADNVNKLPFETQHEAELITYVVHGEFEHQSFKINLFTVNV